jgi:hypothetical protein
MSLFLPGARLSLAGRGEPLPCDSNEKLSASAVARRCRKKTRAHERELPTNAKLVKTCPRTPNLTIRRRTWRVLTKPCAHEVPTSEDLSPRTGRTHEPDRVACPRTPNLAIRPRTWKLLTKPCAHEVPTSEDLSPRTHANQSRKRRPVPTNPPVKTCPHEPTRTRVASEDLSPRTRPRHEPQAKTCPHEPATNHEPDEPTNRTESQVKTTTAPRRKHATLEPRESRTWRVCLRALRGCGPEAKCAFGTVRRGHECRRDSGFARPFVGLSTVSTRETASVDSCR